MDPSGHFGISIKKAFKKAGSKVASTAKKAASTAKKAASTVVNTTKKAASKVASTTKKAFKNKNVQKVALGAAVIGACGLVALSGGSAIPLYCAMAGGASLAVKGGAAGAAYHVYKNGTTKGIGKSIASGAATGFAAGTVVGAAVGFGYVAATGATTAGRCAGQCFVAGTKVLSAKGHVNIEDIQAGDYVWSTNPDTGETALKKVVRTFVNETYTLVHVKTKSNSTNEDEEITTTLEHPFYVDGKGWTGAGELKDGDKLTLITGQTVSVQSVVVEQCIEPVKVYNFEVEDFHTYYVGHESVLVHNKCKLSSFNKLADKYLKKLGLNAHDIKYEYLGKKAKISLYDLYVDKSTGIIYILNKAGEIVVETYYKIKK